MLVLADPIGVFNDYIEQARDLGYETRGGCQVNEASGTSLPLHAYDGDDPRLVTCQGEYYRTSEREPIDLLRVAVELYYGNVAGSPSRTINVSLVKAGDGSGDASRYQHGAPLEKVLDSMPVLPTDKVPELPEAGQRIAPLFSHRAAGLVVPEGSTLAALPARGARCTTGWDAILLTQDVSLVLKRLEEQLAPLAEEPIIHTQAQRGAVTYTSLVVDPAGDERVEVVAADEARGGSVLVSAC
jgi:hypothetical protein